MTVWGAVQKETFQTVTLPYAAVQLLFCERVVAQRPTALGTNCVAVRGDADAK